MGGLLASARLFVRGPIWVVAGLVNAALLVAAIVAILGSASLAVVLAMVCGALLAVVVASFWSFHQIHRETEEKKASLPSRIDDLHRAGASLLKELSAPVEPKETKKGNWEIALADAPAEWWDRVAAFEQQIRDLFMEQYPALLSDYARAAHEHQRAEREAREARAAANEADPSRDKRSDAEKMWDFANQIRKGPAERVEASLEGLAAARHRVG